MTTADGQPIDLTKPRDYWVKTQEGWGFSKCKPVFYSPRSQTDEYTNVVVVAVWDGPNLVHYRPDQLFSRPEAVQ